MVRSTLSPGPYEGQKILDREGHEVGEVQELHILGMHIVGFKVQTGEGLVEVPRDWFDETTAHGIQLIASRDDILGLPRE